MVRKPDARGLRGVGVGIGVVATSLAPGGFGP